MSASHPNSVTLLAVEIGTGQHWYSRIVPVAFQGRMSRKSLETLHDLARAGYSLKVTCEKCGHVVVMDPHALRERCRIAGISPRLEAVEQRLKCTVCGGGGTTWPSLANST